MISLICAEILILYLPKYLNYKSLQQLIHFLHRNIDHSNNNKGGVYLGNIHNIYTFIYFI